MPSCNTIHRGVHAAAKLTVGPLMLACPLSAPIDVWRRATPRAGDRE